MDNSGKLAVAGRFSVQGKVERVQRAQTQPWDT